MVSEAQRVPPALNHQGVRDVIPGAVPPLTHGGSDPNPGVESSHPRLQSVAAGL